MPASKVKGVVESDMQPLDVPAEELLLDPYAYQPGIGSRIAGLATGRTGHDLNYVFHTDYVSAGRGHAEAEIRFTGLVAREGSLMVRVHLLRQGDRPQLVLVTSERIAFNRLAQNGGQMSIRFEAFSNCLYAVYGSVLGDTDARAEDLQVLLRKPQLVEEAGFHAEARNSSHGRSSARPHAMLLSTDVPTLRGPVSQVATAAQLRSREAGAILAEAGVPATASPLERWSIAYVVRALEAYGVLVEHSRGLGFTAPDDPIARLVDARGVPVECLFDATSGSPRLPDRDMVNFDFLWRAEPVMRAPSKQDWITGVEHALKALLPGGLAVFTFGYDPTPPILQPSLHADTRLVTRREIEQVALILVSRGHEVAQLRIVGNYGPLVRGEDGVRSVAGLIVRRARVAD